MKKISLILALFLASCRPAEEIQVFPTKVTLIDIQVVKRATDQKLYALIYKDSRDVLYRVLAFDTTSHFRGEWAVVLVTR